MQSFQKEKPLRKRKKNLSRMVIETCFLGFCFYDTAGSPSSQFLLLLFGCLNYSYYICNMKKEFGKWLMDIAKYMVTALLLSTIFADMAEPIILWMVVIFSAVTLIAGLIIIYNSEQEENSNKKKSKQ